MDLSTSNFSMKKKIIILSIVASLSVVSVPSFFAISLFTFDSPYSNIFSSVLKDKIKHLEKHKNDKKIVFIGNSSIPFGLRCDLVEKHLPNYKAIDFGLYGSLGTKVMIDLAKNYISKDDIVILAPEQTLQSQSLYFSGKDYLMAIDGKLDYIFRLDRKDIKKVIGDIPSFTSKRLQYTISNTAPQIEGIYVRDSFNEYFDIDSTLCSSNILPNNYDDLTLVDLNKQLYTQDYIDYVNNFNKFVLKQESKLYYAFSPTNPLCIVHNENIDEYQLELINKLDFPIINSLQDVTLDPLYFFDTNFHLNNAGAIISTKRLIQSIKLILKDTSKTDIHEPRPPKKEDQEEIKGDNRCLDYFNYEETENGYRIVSLSESGLKANSIIIPFSYNDEKIYEFDRNIFSNAYNLKELVIQSNITRLKDGSFTGAKSLESVTLKHNSPSSINVGKYLLSEANPNIKIYVPKEALHTFKLNYARSHYAEHIYPANN